MQLKHIFLTACLAAGLLSCRTAKPPAAAVPPTSLYAYGPAFAALWQQRAAEYKALCFQAYNIARVRLDESLRQQDRRPLAIVTDIDETILDNSPYTVHTSLRGQAYTDMTWQQWTSKAAADTVPGALSFLRFAASRGVSVFYITNRMEAERSATLKNLQRWHFPNADNEHLLPKTVTSSKEERRLQVAKEYDIIMLMGDNLGDFAAMFDKQPYQQRDQATSRAAADFGKRFIVLPNPMYGDWLPALFDYNYQLPPAQVDSVLKAKLKDY